MFVKGVNLGNWLVLAKWMEPALFEGYRAEDEDTLATVAPKDQLAQRIRHHRDTYITERAFREIAACGMNLVRLPVPYTVFESEPPLGPTLQLQQRRILNPLHRVEDGGGATAETWQILDPLHCSGNSSIF